MDYLIDLSYRPLYLAVCEFNSKIQSNSIQEKDCQETIISDKKALEKLLRLFPEKARTEVLNQIVCHEKFQVIESEKFQDLKKDFIIEQFIKFQVKPITYFSLGGIAHTDFRTNLKNVYVTGECMHDFGANRIGGLPWGLYLASGRIICEHIANQLQADEKPLDFELVFQKSNFDWQLLKAIKGRLYEYQEKNFSEAHAEECIYWFRETRSTLISKTENLSDSIAWLIVAEAIMQSSLCRRESRGYFFRSDFPLEDENLDKYFSCVWYDRHKNVIKARLLEASSFDN